MQTIAQALSTVRRGGLTTAPDLPASAVAAIFDSLKGQFSAKMADMWEGVPWPLIEREWCAGLAGFAKSEILRGVEECRTRTFPPTLGEFVKLCRPATDPEFAWHEAVDGLAERDRVDDDGRPLRGTWTHPGVFFAASRMSSEVRGGDYHRHRIRWARVLKQELAHGFRPIPEPAMPLASPSRPAPLTEDRRAYHAQLSQKIREDIARRAQESDQ